MQVTQSQKKLVRNLNNLFALICVLLACYMTSKETYRYLKNDDTSTISYKRFGETVQDVYPTFSFCSTDDHYDWTKSQGVSGLLYSYLKDEIANSLPIAYADHSTLAQILEGQTVLSGSPDEDELDIRNISDAYVNLFAIELEKLYYMI